MREFFNPRQSRGRPIVRPLMTDGHERLAAYLLPLEIRLPLFNKRCNALAKILRRHYHGLDAVLKPQCVIEAISGSPRLRALCMPSPREARTPRFPTLRTNVRFQVKAYSFYQLANALSRKMLTNECFLLTNPGLPGKRRQQSPQERTFVRSCLREDAVVMALALKGEP